MSYAIIRVGGKQYRVQPGQRLLVDRLAHDEGAAFEPPVLLVGGDGEADLAPAAGVVTARVVRHVLGEKIRIGKYRKRTGYKRHNGHRSRLSQIEIEAVGGAKAAPKAKAEPAVAVVAAPVAEPAAPVAEPKPKAPPKPRAAKPKADADAPAAEEKPAAEKKPARKPAAKKTETEGQDGA
jgi:large subunit ribosomal protein L21